MLRGRLSKAYVMRAYVTWAFVYGVRHMRVRYVGVGRTGRVEDLYEDRITQHSVIAASL